MKKILFLGVILFLAFVAFVGCHKEPIDFGNVGMLNIGLTRGYKTANKTAIELFDARVTVYYSEEDTVAYNCHFADLDGDGRYANDLSEDDRVYVRSDVGFWVGVWAVIQGDTVVAMSDPTNLLYLSEENPVLDVDLVLEAGYPRILVSGNYEFVEGNLLFYGEVLEGSGLIDSYYFFVKRGTPTEEERRMWATRNLTDMEYEMLLDNYEPIEAYRLDNDANRFVGVMEMYDYEYDMDSVVYSVVAMASLPMDESDSIPTVIHSQVSVITVTGYIEPEPISTDPGFEWIRQGGGAATGLDEFGLYWQINAKGIFAQIKPYEDAKLYILTSSDYAITDMGELSQRLASETEATVYNNVSVDSNGTYDDVIATVYSGKTYLINVKKSVMTSDNNGTRIVVTGTYKMWTSEQEETQYSLPTGHINGYGYVDLGLPSGTLWAYTNIGAINPYDRGNYYAWGETSTKETYNWATYQYCNGDSASLTKYCNDATYGNGSYTDRLTTLESSDDAATVNRGSGWRMPTQTDFQELLDNCTRTYRYIGRINGYLMTGPNGNSIFLPDAGNINGSEINGTTVGNGDFGDYWTSTLGSDSYKAYMFWFYSEDFLMDECERNFGLSVRPVCVQSKKKRK